MRSVDVIKDKVDVQLVANTLNRLANVIREESKKSKTKPSEQRNESEYDVAKLFGRIVYHLNNTKVSEQPNKSEHDVAQAPEQPNKSEHDVAQAPEQRNESEHDVAQVSEQRNESEQDLAQVSEQRNESEQDLAQVSEQPNESEQDLAQLFLESTYYKNNSKAIDDIVNPKKNLLAQYRERFRLALVKSKGYFKADETDDKKVGKKVTCTAIECFKDEEYLKDSKAIAGIFNTKEYKDETLAELNPGDQDFKALIAILYSISPYVKDNKTESAILEALAKHLSETIHQKKATRRLQRILDKPENIGKVLGLTPSVWSRFRKRIRSIFSKKPKRAKTEDQSQTNEKIGLFGLLWALIRGHEINPFRGRCRDDIGSIIIEEVVRIEPKKAADETPHDDDTEEKKDAQDISDLYAKAETPDDNKSVIKKDVTDEKNERLAISSIRHSKKSTFG